jgi:predicted ABC-type ATPase
LTRLLRASGVDLGRYINADDIAAKLRGSYVDRVRRAQILAEEQRQACLADGCSFTFETVMSHPSKLELMRQAKGLGYRIILYFVATDDPDLNIRRVAQRVALGGHDVPADRVLARYHRTLGLLAEASAIADETALFDNTQIVRPANAATGLRLVGRRVDGVVTILEPQPGWVASAGF